MPRRLKILLLFDYPVRPPKDEDYAKGMDKADWKPIRVALSALKKLGHQAFPHAVHDDILGLIKKAAEIRPDAVLNMADSFKNDRRYEGALVALMELLGLKVTGCPPAALSLCNHKGHTKRVLSALGLKVPKDEVWLRGEPAPLLKTLKFPVVVKPMAEEGSEGMSQASFARKPSQALARARWLHKRLRQDALIEEYIQGREIYAGMIGNGKPRLLPLREMVFGKAREGEPRLATYKGKWDRQYRKRQGLRNLFAKPFPAPVKAAIDQACRLAFKALGLRGLARLDLRVTPKGEVHVLEANPNPSLSVDDEIAQAAKKAGLSYPKLLQTLIDLAREAAKPS